MKVPVIVYSVLLTPINIAVYVYIVSGSRSVNVTFTLLSACLIMLPGYNVTLYLASLIALLQLIVTEVTADVVEQLRITKIEYDLICSYSCQVACNLQYLPTSTEGFPRLCPISLLATMFIMYSPMGASISAVVSLTVIIMYPLLIIMV